MEIQKQQAVIYLRKSQDRKGQKYSIEAQRSEIKRFADNNNFVLVGEYVEVGSGASAHNIPIIVLRVDRISRKNSHLAKLMENPKLTFIIAELGISATPFQISLFGLLATEERALLSRRVKDGMRKAAEAGVLFGTNWEPGLKAAHEANRARGRRTSLSLGRSVYQLKKGLDRNNNQVGRPMSYAEVVVFLNTWEVAKASGKTGTWTRSECCKMVQRYNKELNHEQSL